MEKLTQSEKDFLFFVQNTLIPDLRESDQNSTADDFDKMLSIIEKLEAN